MHRKGDVVEAILIEEGSMVKKGRYHPEAEQPRSLHLYPSTARPSLPKKENFLREHPGDNGYRKRISIKRELISLTYDIERKERIYRQNSVLIKDSLISREEFIQVKGGSDMALSSTRAIPRKGKEDSIFRSCSGRNP